MTKTYEEILTAMQDRYRELSGFDADSASDIGIRLRVLAQQVFTLHGRLEQLEQQTFPQTSTGIYLERHAQFRGLTRKGALPAQGVLRFSREIPATVDIPIAPGIICATRPSPQVHFEVVKTAVLPAGRAWVDIDARAVEPGAQGNVAPGSVCLMVSTVAGLTAVTNAAAFAGGADEESDDALRERLLTGYRNIANGTNSAFYYERAMQYDGVLSANIIPRARGRGTVDVVISCSDSVSGPDTAAKLQAELSASKEINVDVAVREAKTRAITIQLDIAVKEGYDYEAVRSQCDAALTEHLGGLGVGEALLLARMSGRLCAVEGLYNHSFRLPEMDQSSQPDGVWRAGVVVIGRMEVV